MANRQLVDYLKEQLSHKADINFPAVAIAAAAVVVLAGVLFLLVFKETAPNTPIDTPIDQPVIKDEPNVPIRTLSGWEKCQAEEDSVTKDACYQKLNRDAEFDCTIITDDEEQGNCYRAKEAVLLQAYMQGA